MNLNKSIPIWRDVNALLIAVENSVKHFPRYHKYTLGSEMRLKALAQPQSVYQGADFLGYIVRPDYRLVRRRVINHCRHKLHLFEEKCFSVLQGKEQGSSKVSISPPSNSLNSEMLPTIFYEREKRSNFPLLQRGIEGDLQPKGVGFTDNFVKPSICKSPLTPLYERGGLSNVQRPTSNGGYMRVNLDILQQLRSILASYLGHFTHAHCQTTIARLWAEFPWLHALFDLDEQQLKLSPLYENTTLPYYRLQCDFFCAVFPNAMVVIQRGRENEIFTPDGVGRYQTATSLLAQQGQAYRAAISKVVVKESGLSKHGIKRRVLNEIYF